MRRFPRLTQLYILAIIAAGILVLLISLPLHVGKEELILFATLAVSGVLAGSYPLPLVYSHLRIDLTGGILLMAVFLANPPWPVFWPPWSPWSPASPSGDAPGTWLSMPAPRCWA